MPDISDGKAGFSRSQILETKDKIWSRYQVPDTRYKKIRSRHYSYVYQDRIRDISTSFLLRNYLQSILSFGFSFLLSIFIFLFLSLFSSLSLAFRKKILQYPLWAQWNFFHRKLIKNSVSKQHWPNLLTPQLSNGSCNCICPTTQPTNTSPPTHNLH